MATTGRGGGSITEQKSDFNSPAPFAMQGTPPLENGIRYQSAKELVELCGDPKFRKALDIAQKDMSKNFPEMYAGKPMAIKRLYQKQLVHDFYADTHARVQEKIISEAIKKAKKKQQFKGRVVL